MKIIAYTEIPLIENHTPQKYNIEVQRIKGKLYDLWSYLEDRKKDCEYEAYFEVVDIQKKVEEILGWRNPLV